MSLADEAKNKYCALAYYEVRRFVLRDYNRIYFGLIFYHAELVLLKITMKNKIYPPDQAKVLFTDLKGVRREGVYVMDMNAYVELVENSETRDCSNIFPENEIIQWEFLETENSDSEFISVL